MVVKTDKSSMPDLDKALIKAVAKKDVSEIENLYGQGANPFVVDKGETKYRCGYNEDSGVAAIHVAMNRDMPPEILELLLAYPDADPNLCSKDGTPLLHFALRRLKGDLRSKIVDRLIELGVDTNGVDNTGQTALFELIIAYTYSDEAQLFDRLVQAGADPNRSNQYGGTLVDEMYYRASDNFHEFNDQAGFVRLFAYLLRQGARSGLDDPDMQKEYETWVAAKSAPHSELEDPPAKALFDTIVGDAIDDIHQAIQLEIEGEHEGVACFNWFELLREKHNDETIFADQILQYHIADGAMPMVETFDWIPFGIVGMQHPLESYAEISATGTLLLNLPRATGDDAPVIFVPNFGPMGGPIHRLTEREEPRLLPLSFRELMATLRKGENPRA